MTGPENIPHAILIRAFEPLDGIDIMLERRKLKKFHPQVTSGPGCVSRALGIQMTHNGIDLTEASNKIWLENSEKLIADQDIVSSPRIGVESSGESSLLHYRFTLRNSPFLSAKSFTKRFY